MAERKRTFPPSFFKRFFPQLVGGASSGYPDMGEGIYASKLSHDQWFRFGRYQRVHYNYVEGIATAIVLELVAGLFYPGSAVLCGILYIVGRELFALGYRNLGPKARLPGTIIMDLGLFLLLLMALGGSFNAAGGIEGFLSFALSPSRLQEWTLSFSLSI